jgi:nifR3 family TIM-barrel protein
MAGVTNAAFRSLCRGYGPGLFVTEMVTARALQEGNVKTLRMIAPAAGEWPRSLQLYGTDPATLAWAVNWLCERELADHIDLNFGCPAPKVTRRGGGAALPWKTELFKQIVAQTVAAAGRYNVPLTVKMRLGIDSEHLTYMQCGLIAQAEGVAAITLHARTAAQMYSGQADWQTISKLKQLVSHVPIIGNGDVFTAQDAEKMITTTGCDGVAVGRGVLGRPWLFAELARLLPNLMSATSSTTPLPETTDLTLGQVVAVIERHAELLVEHYRQSDQWAQKMARRPSVTGFAAEHQAIIEMRGQVAYYLRGFPVGGAVRHKLGLVNSLIDLHVLLTQLPDQALPVAQATARRGRAGQPAKVALPANWLASQQLTEQQTGLLHEPEISAAGG